MGNILYVTSNNDNDKSTEEKQDNIAVDDISKVIDESLEESRFTIRLPHGSNIDEKSEQEFLKIAKENGFQNIKIVSSSPPTSLENSENATADQPEPQEKPDEEEFDQIEIAELEDKAEIQPSVLPKTAIVTGFWFWEQTWMQKYRKLFDSYEEASIHCLKEWDEDCDQVFKDALEYKAKKMNETNLLKAHPTAKISIESN